MNNGNRIARDRGLRLAARIAGLGGIALAVVGMVEAEAAGAATPPAPMEPGAIASAPMPAADGASGKLPLEAAVVRGGNCGCSPCWGPPAPPRRGSACR